MLCLQWARNSHVHLSCSSHGHRKGGKVISLSPSMLRQRGLADKKSGPSSSQAEVTLERRKKEAGTARAETEVPRGWARSGDQAPGEKCPGSRCHPAPRSRDPTQQKQLQGSIFRGKAGPTGEPWKEHGQFLGRAGAPSRGRRTNPQTQPWGPRRSPQSHSPGWPLSSASGVLIRSQWEIGLSPTNQASEPQRSVCFRKKIIIMMMYFLKLNVIRRVVRAC